MESKTNYTIVGLSVLILVTGLIFSSIWLSVGFDKKKYDVYAVYMHEAVSGLSPDAPVKFNGVKVGYVKSIRLNQNNPQQVELLLNVSHEIPITQSTTATLISQGITGNTYIGLSASSSDLTLIKVRPGEPYPIIPARPSLFNQLDNALKGVSENINAVTLEIKRVFDKENAENIKKTLQNFRLLTDSLEKDRSQIHDTITNLKKGTSSLSQDTIPAANALLKHLNHITSDLEKTTREVKSNPAMLIRGKEPDQPGPGE